MEEMIYLIKETETKQSTELSTRKTTIKGPSNVIFIEWTLIRKEG